MAADLAQFIQAVVAFSSAYPGQGIVDRAFASDRDYLDKLASPTASSLRTDVKNELTSAAVGLPPAWCTDA